VAVDWLSRLFEMMPVRGRLDLRCSYGSSWRIEWGPGAAGEIPIMRSSEVQRCLKILPVLVHCG
jgi:hypothetical protein